MSINKCWKCGTETQKFQICDDCYAKWEQDRVICQICETKKTGSKIGVCSTCKTPLIEEAVNFLKSKADYWNMIKERVKKTIVGREREFKCSTESCKTKFLISNPSINKIIICPSCGNKMQ